MANYCNNNLHVSRLDWWSLTEEEIWAFLRKEPINNTWTEVEVNGEKYYFSYQFVVPIEQDDNWYSNNVDWWWCKWDWAYDALPELDDKSLYIWFDTPWCPPHRWCEALCKKFPELKITLEYDEPLMCFQWRMWRNEKWELFDDYREWEEYLHECYWCWYNLEDTKYREDLEDFLCDKCYLDIKKRNEANWLWHGESVFKGWEDSEI